MPALFAESILPEWVPEDLRGPLEGPLGIALLLLAVSLVTWMLAAFTGNVWRSLFGTPGRTPETGLEENLAEYPPPPGQPGPRRLTVEGVPVRVRLIVVAPVGRNRPIGVDDVEELVDQVIRGMKEIVQKDKPRIRLWSPQLSKTGFPQVFHRLTLTPDEEGQPSVWVRVAGPANAEGRPILLGLGLLADRPTDLGKLSVQPERWFETLRIVTLGGA